MNLVRVLLALFIVSALFVVFRVETKAACYCVNPVRDGCACSSPPPSNATYETSFNGIPLKCTDPRDPNSVFSIKDPVCDSRWNNEIPPYCAFSGDSEVTCWGIGFVQDPGTAFSTGGRWIDWPDPKLILTFNGFTSDRNNNGVNEEVTSYVGCHANVFCCGRSDASCGPNPQDQITGGCGPKGDQEDFEIIAACHGVSDTFLGPHSGQGESRLWFSQVRLVAALSSIAQTLFNPFRLTDDNRYQPNALSKNAPISDPSGRYNNQGTLTTRVERYQGVHDDTVVVNQVDNNSSVIVRNPAPGPLFSFDNSRQNFPYDDARACYIPYAVSNPGDDLIGPRIKGELLFTEEFSYRALPNTNCVEDGESYVPVAGEGQSRCCSQRGRTSNACYLLFPGEICDPVAETQQICVGLASCCPVGSACTDNRITCESPDPIELPAEGYADVFSKTPLIEYIYNTIVDGTDSLYKRFFPIQFWVDSSGVDIPFEEIPAKAGFRASVSGNVTSTAYAEGQANSPEIYFPHLGSLDKYWLYDFQKGLRPQGYARGEPSGELIPPNLQCALGRGNCAPDAVITNPSDASKPPINFNEVWSGQHYVASQICHRESRSSDTAANIGCLTGRSYDFSLGLFQINRAPVPHYDSDGKLDEIREYNDCKGAFDTNITPDKLDSEGRLKYCKVLDDGTDCSDLIPGLSVCNANLRNCILKYFNPYENVSAALAKFRSSGWCPWRTNDPSLSCGAVCNQ